MAHLAHYKEAHPMPFVILHWINVVCMIVLIITGFCIHFPFWPYFMGIARGMHVFCGILITLVWVLRVILAFFIKTAPTGGTRKVVPDWKTWAPQKDNRHQALEWIKYYLFLKKEHPLGAKLGVPQKISYLMIPLVILVMCYTGLCIWGPTLDWGICVAGLNLVGGAMHMRIIHYFLMYFFIFFMMIHVYLANVEGTEPTKLMFFHKEHGGLTYDPDLHNIDGEDYSVGGHH